MRGRSGTGWPVAEEPFSERLKRLEERIAAAKAVREVKPARHGGEYSQGSVAWRMVTELVVGMLLGLAIGYAIDSLAGTRPVFLVVFSLLGFAGGVRAMMRTAEDMTRGRTETGSGVVRTTPADDKTDATGHREEE